MTRKEPIQIRRAERADLRPLALLWTQAFPGERTVEDRVRQLESGVPYGGLEVAWVAEERGRLLGAYRAYRMTEYVAGVPLPMLGLASVATSAAARRRGVGRALCRHALRQGRERGDVLSVLYPFRPSFYRTFGWELVGELEAYRFRPGALPDYEEAAAVRFAEPADRDAIAACYARVAGRSTGPLERDARVWAHHLDAAGIHAVVHDDGGRIGGYALVRFGRPRAPGAATLHVRELIAEDDEAYRALLGWITAQRDQFSEVRYDARPDERLEFRLTDPRPPAPARARRLWFPTARRIRGPMLRVLNVPAALAARPRWGESPGFGLTLEVEVLDDELPENRGPWHVSIEEEGARVHDRRAGGADARLVVGPATFAQIYAGELPPSVAARLGLAPIEGAADALDRAFHLPSRFWLLDEF